MQSLSSVVGAPSTSTSSLTDDKPSLMVLQFVALFNDFKAGRDIHSYPWEEFQLEPGEYDQLEREISRDESLSGYVKHKLRYDYDRRIDRLVVRKPTAVHNLFIDNVEDAIRSQLKDIRGGSEKKAALFARKIHPTRSTTIHFPTDDGPHSKKAKHDPDASFLYIGAKYPGVIIEVTYSQKAKRLNRLAEDYLLDSNGGVRAVIGLNIEYGRKGSRKATLSVWRIRKLKSDTGKVWTVIKEPADEAFRDDQGSPTNHLGLLLHLSDFACEPLAQDIAYPDQELKIPAQQLCQFLNAAEETVQIWESVDEIPLPPGVRKMKRSATPYEEIKYVEQWERAAKRIAEEGVDSSDSSRSR